MPTLLLRFEEREQLLGSLNAFDSRRWMNAIRSINQGLRDGDIVGSCPCFKGDSFLSCGVCRDVFDEKSMVIEDEQDSLLRLIGEGVRLVKRVRLCLRHVRRSSMLTLV